MSILRSGKKLKVQSNMSADSVAELSRLVKSLAEKIDKLEASSQSRPDTILTKLTTLETTTSELFAGLEAMNQEMETVKETLVKKADVVQVELLEKKLEEMENRSKRNNIAIWNIPEGVEKDSSCLALVTSILTERMGLEEIHQYQTTAKYYKRGSSTKASPYIFTKIYRQGIHLA